MRGQQVRSVQDAESPEELAKLVTLSASRAENYVMNLSLYCTKAAVSDSCALPH